MSTYEAAYKSLLQGVSQQLPQERLAGQLTSQVNMMSDPVTNIRRRAGIKAEISWLWTGADTDHVAAWFTDIAGFRVHILLNSNTGNVRVLDESYNLLASLNGGAYLTSSNIKNIRATSLGNEFFLANCGIKPTLSYTGAPADPRNSGFFYVLAGAFSKGYSVTINSPAGSITATYTTPSGTGAGDAALSTPEYIATQLATGLAGTGWTITRVGPYVYVNHTGSATSVSSSTGTGYLITSKGGFVDTIDKLPAQLPSVADGYICRVGSGKSPAYYQFKYSTVEWVEVGDYTSPTSITNVPISITYNGTSWVLVTTAFEGRFAGDDVSNEPHDFMTNGITGLGTYQGRLVILSGSMVSLSASNKPRRFFRSTLSSLLANDPIEVGSGMNSAAAYEYAIPFQRDLILFSRKYQAVISGGNVALTPSNATVTPTSTHEADTTSAPIPMGRTLMYCNPRSESFFGVLEMIPSTYTDSQYISQDSTPHLPKYMGGRCRFAVASGVASIGLFAPTGDETSLIVHEYHWDGDTKVQQAWHMWTTQYAIASAYFAADKIHVVTVRNGMAVLGTIDPRAGALTLAGIRRPFLDLNVQATIVNHQITIPSWMLTLDPTIGSKLQAIVATGDLAGELVGTTPSLDGTKLNTVLSYPSGTVVLGLPYYSGIVPTPPIVKDYNGDTIFSGKATLLRYNVGTKNSSEFQVQVNDDRSQGDVEAGPTLSWSSQELELGRGLFSDEFITLVPCRTDLRSTAIEMYTRGTGELNIISLEYVAKFHPKIKRR